MDNLRLTLNSQNVVLLPAVPAPSRLTGSRTLEEKHRNLNFYQVHKNSRSLELEKASLSWGWGEALQLLCALHMRSSSYALPFSPGQEWAWWEGLGVTVTTSDVGEQSPATLWSGLWNCLSSHCTQHDSKLRAHGTCSEVTPILLCLRQQVS